MGSVNNPDALKTGADPRALPDYIALRSELAKLSHPARPDVDWNRVEQLSLSLFRQNGVELQTACGYTLARTHLSGITGLNEGLAILEALLTNHWDIAWPKSDHARVKILVGISQRLQTALRSFTLCDEELPLIYQSEQHLNRLHNLLQCWEFSKASRMGELCTFMHNTAVKLESTEGNHNDSAAELVPVLTARPAERQAAVQPEPHVYVIRKAMTTSLPDKLSAWKAFAAGMLTMLLVGAVGLVGWQKIKLPSDNPFPVVASKGSLSKLARLAPLWRQRYGFELAEGSVQLRTQWQEYIDANALPTEALSGWHQGMEGLEELTHRLNALDERKGKYLTGSELKSMVFAIVHNFERTVPVEEQLYQLSQIDSATPLRAAQLMRTDTHFNQLLNRYALIEAQSD